MFMSVGRLEVPNGAQVIRVKIFARPWDALCPLPRMLPEWNQQWLSSAWDSSLGGPEIIVCSQGGLGAGQCPPPDI